MGLAVMPKEMMDFLIGIGFEFERQSGTSHRIYKKGDKTVTIPIHTKEISIGTLGNILRQSGTTKKELEKWLGR